jgi:hypothetical protein
MAEDFIEEIDEMLNEELPDNPSEVTNELDESRKEEMIQLLNYAADELGESPTIREYRDLDLETSASSIRRAFGTWNEAKEAAGLETRQRGTTVSINEEYFADIDAPEKAYWLGTLYANSYMGEQERGDNYYLNVGRVVSNRHFVEEFANAIDSEYPIYKSTKQKSSEEDTLQLRISNPEFIDNLIRAGYPAPGHNLNGFPSLEDEYRADFVRGYLESAGYFSTQGWEIRVENNWRARTFKDWFEDFGAKRPTTSEKSSSGVKVRVSNVFDIRAVFDACWPQQAETEPSWEPYVEKIIDYLQTEHPYPENVPYLSD